MSVHVSWIRSEVQGSVLMDWGSECGVEGSRFRLGDWVFILN